MDTRELQFREALTKLLVDLGEHDSAAAAVQHTALWCKNLLMTEIASDKMSADERQQFMMSFRASMGIAILLFECISEGLAGAETWPAQRRISCEAFYEMGKKMIDLRAGREIPTH